MVEVILKINREHNSICQIKQDDNIMYLTEKEVEQLVEEIISKRMDVVENTKLYKDYKLELEYARDTDNEDD